MSSVNPLRHFALVVGITSTLVGLLLLLALGAYRIAGPSIIEHVYVEQTPSFLANPIQAHRSKDPAVRDLAFYQAKIPQLLLRWCFLFLKATFAALLLVGLFLWRRTLFEHIRLYFSQADSPINLAVVRFLLFGYLAFRSYPQHSQVFETLSSEAIFAPHGSAWLAALFPWNDLLVTSLAYVFFYACVFSALGWKTRLATLTAAVTGYVVLLVPNLFGKVDHDYHHLWWFVVLFAFSRCGDALSVDAARRRKTRALPPPSVAYALPIRLMWLLLGIAYFFPGWYKWFYGGMDWFLSDNLKYWIHDKWFELGQVATFRIDHYPLLYKAGALGTILWEMGFVFLLFVPRLRWLAPVGGLAFHLSARAFLMIDFQTLMVSYVLFVPWERVFRKLGFAFDTLSQRVSVARTTPALILVGTGLVLGNLYYGVQQIGQGWPFACYPSFGFLAHPTKRTIEVGTESLSGQFRVLSPQELGPFYSSTSLGEIFRRAVRANQTHEKQAVLNKLASVILRNHLYPDYSKSLIFNEVTVATDPDRWADNPLERRRVSRYTISELERSNTEALN